MIINKGKMWNIRVELSIKRDIFHQTKTIRMELPLSNFGTNLKTSKNLILKAARKQQLLGTQITNYSLILTILLTKSLKIVRMKPHTRLIDCHMGLTN